MMANNNLFVGPYLLEQLTSNYKLQSSLYLHGRQRRWMGKKNLGLWGYKGCTREEEETEHKIPAKQWLLQALPSKLPCSLKFSILISAWHPECFHPTLLKVLYTTWGAYYLTENFVNSEWKVNGKVTCWKYQPRSVHSGWYKPNGNVTSL